MTSLKEWNDATLQGRRVWLSAPVFVPQGSKRGEEVLSENPEDLFYLLNHSQVEKITPTPANIQSEKLYSAKSSALIENAY